MTGPSDDGQAGAVVTDADRKTALRVIRELAFVPLGHDMSPAADVVAAALAAERAKARAPFLSVATDLDRWQDNAVRYAAHSGDDSTTAAMARARAMAYGRATEAIRRAAEEGQR